MGSRITRALYTNERRLGIGKQRQQQIQRGVSYFVSFLLLILIFLHGFLLSTYLNKYNFVGPLFLLLMSMAYFNKKVILNLLILNGIFFFLTFLFQSIFSFSVPLLVLSLSFQIIGHILIQTELLMPLNSKQTILIWLIIQIFHLGIITGVHLHQITNTPFSGFIQIFFSLLILMLLILSLLGTKYLPRFVPVQHISFFYELFGIIFNFLIFIGLFLCRSGSTLQSKSISIFLTFILCSVANKLKVFEYLNFCGVILVIVVIITNNIGIQRDNLSVLVLLTLEEVSLNIILIDVLFKWQNRVRIGNGKPFYIVYIYFSTFVVGILSNISNYLNQHRLYLIIITTFLYGGINYHYRSQVRAL